MRSLVGLSILALMAVVCVYGFMQLAYYEEVVDQGPSPRAKANPYLAAEYFLRQRSVPVSVADTWLHLPDPRQQRQTLLMLDSRAGMTPGQVDALLEWVDAGGHLVLAAEQLWEPARGRSGDLLLDTLGIRHYLTRDIKAHDRQQAAAESGLPIPLVPAPYSVPKTPWPELTRLYLENEQAPAYMSFDPAYHLEDPDDAAHSWANSAEATHLLQIDHGEGLITVLSDAQLWKTRAIARHDNAWLLWYLTQDSAVTMVVQTRHDNLITLLLRHFPLAVAALTLLLVLTLWQRMIRTGPVRSPAPRARRQLGEHANACADFMTRHGGQQAVLKNLQLDIMRRARLRHPGFDRLPVAEQWQVLARLSRQTTSFIGDALRPRPVQRYSKADFTRQVAHLQTLRNCL
jgi:hypothetical protein